jgi:peptide/nickel transport system ATP-binding protein/oligopeptide transport system ATP-binding protein
MPLLINKGLSTGDCKRMDNRFPLLELKELKTHFFTRKGVIKAVDKVSFKIHRGETLGVVGESGCGKSVSALSIMRLIPSPPGRIVGGEILFEGKDLLKMVPKEMEKVRGNEISMIFQEPMTCLNPVFNVGEQIGEAIRIHQGLGRKEAFQKSVEMLRWVGIPSPERRIYDYPHQMSGGMRQRIMIAMALSSRPKLLIADEPTTALDVTIQSQILELINALKEELGISVLFITHNLGVVAEVAQRAVVMYAGKVMEEANVRDLFHHPLHPYTRGLLNSVPAWRRSGRQEEKRARLQEIPGMVPNLLNLPEGCSFFPRCPEAKKFCQEKVPTLALKGEGHSVRCWSI